MVIRTSKRKTRLTVTVNPELKALAETIAREDNTTASGVVSRCLEQLAHDRKEKLMIEYYQSMAREHGEFADKSAEVIQKIASAWSD